MTPPDVDAPGPVDPDEYAEFLAWKAARDAAAVVPIVPTPLTIPSTAVLFVPDPPVPVPARRPPRPLERLKLHLGHFAFWRAYVQGLDLHERWDHYLGQHGIVTDLRAIRKAVDALRAGLAAVARRHGKPGMARLLAIDVNQIVVVAPTYPTLEQFVEERELEDFSVAAQMEAYRDEYGTPTRRQAARERLLKKQLTTLRWLQDLAAERPQADDAVGAWLIPELAGPIEAAGVVTLRQLAERINGVGLGWYRSMRAIGAGKAKRVVDWMRQAQADTGLTIGAHVDTPRGKLTAADLAQIVAPAVDIVPLDKFLVPPSLCGSAGQYRAPRAHCTLGVDTDLQALIRFIRAKPGLTPEQQQERAAQWLAQHRGESLPDGPFAWTLFLTATQKAYLDEVYRFMLWSVLQRNKALSSIDIDDAGAYRDFLADPQPFERWCSRARGRTRFGPAWRPFAGPLGPVAASRAMTMLGTFYGFLVAHGYMTSNPFSGVAKPRAAPTPFDQERSFTAAQWHLVNVALDALAPTSANQRLCFGLRLMYATGLRRAEAVAAQVGHLHWVSYPPDDHDPEIVEGYELRVVGKGSVARTVPVPPGVIDDLVTYLQARGLAGNPADQDNKAVYLLGQAVDIAARAPWATTARQPVDPRAGIGAQTWYDQLTGFFKQCAARLAPTDPASAAQFERASTHFLRHTKISHSLAAGTDADIERAVAGHRSIGTTSRYAHAEAKRRMRGSAKFFASSGVQGGGNKY